MAKRTKCPMWSEVLTPAALAENNYLQQAAPAEKLDPNGNWRQCWQIFNLRKTTQESKHQGHIEIVRKNANENVELHIKQANFQGPQRAGARPELNCNCKNGGLLKTVCDTSAELVCNNDKFLSPKSWTISTSMQCVHGNDFDGTRMKKKMSVTNGQLTTECQGRISSHPLPNGSLTSNWGLLNVLSSIDNNSALAFNILDELDKVKTNHKLYRAADVQIPFGADMVNVRCYHQIGCGMLPWEYYVDASTRRVLLAISGLRAYILDSEADKKTLKHAPGFKAVGGAA